MIHHFKYLQNNVVNSKLTLLIYSSLDELLNIKINSTLEDNFKNSYELEFNFNNRNVKDDIQTVIPIGNYKPLPR